MGPTRIPKPEDFDGLRPSLNFILKYPEVAETTTAILIVFHGLGDSDKNFSKYAEMTALPGVLAITVRGVSPLPPALLGLPDDSAPTNHFHWGDDLTISSESGDLDPDPGFAKAEELVLGRLVRETLVGKCGWETSDILLFGYGQGGSLALGLASRLRGGGGSGGSDRVVDVTDGEQEQQSTAGAAFKGVVSIGGPLPTSMIPTLSAREKARTPVLICHGRASELVDGEAVETLKREFADLREVKWTKADDGMPSSKEENLPIMQFYAERLQSEI